MLANEILVSTHPGEEDAPGARPATVKTASLRACLLACETRESAMCVRACLEDDACCGRVVKAGCVKAESVKTGVKTGSVLVCQKPMLACKDQLTHLTEKDRQLLNYFRMCIAPVVPWDLGKMTARRRRQRNTTGRLRGVKTEGPQSYSKAFTHSPSTVPVVTDSTTGSEEPSAVHMSLDKHRAARP
jgi:hypothetical protein